MSNHVFLPQNVDIRTTYPTMKLFIQLELAPRAIPYLEIGQTSLIRDNLEGVTHGRALRGQTSEIRIHAAGPQLAPNAMTNIQTKVTAAQAAAGCAAHWFTFFAKITAKIMWQVPIANAPPIKIGFRPTLSMYKMAGTVATSMAIPTTPVASKDTV